MDFIFPKGKTRLNQAERLLDELINNKREMTISEVAEFFFDDINEYTQKRAMVITAYARKLAAEQYFIISNAHDTKGVYKLEDNARHLYKQAQSSAARSSNGAGRAKTLQTVLACDDSPENRERCAQIQEDLIVAISKATADYMQLAQARKNELSEAE